MGGNGVTANECGVSFWVDENSIKIDCGDGCKTLNVLKTTGLCNLNEWIEWYVVMFKNLQIKV